jgi:hypothetical protein
MTGAADLEVAVVGAGPHGLSAAVHLRRAGVQAHVFGDPMAFWRSMPRGMLLRSNLSATNLIEPRGPLSLGAFGADRGAPIEAPVPLEDFVAYGDWVQQRALPDLDRRLLTRLAAGRQGFSLTLSDGETVRARRVVLACGIAPFRRRPHGFDHLPDTLVSHAADHRELDGFRGRAVTLVGGGQSAFELAALIAEAGAQSVEVLVRAEQIVWLRGHSVKRALGRLGPVVYAPTDVGPLWYSRLVERPALLGLVPRGRRDRIAARCIRPACSHFVRVRLDPVRITTGVTVRSAREAGGRLRLELSDGSAPETDHLILATGYQVDFARYGFLDPGLRGAVRVTGGFPVLQRGLRTSVPGLHVTGAPAAWSFGPIMRFVSGSWYAGAAIARSLRPARAREGAAR